MASPNVDRSASIVLAAVLYSAVAPLRAGAAAPHPGAEMLRRPCASPNALCGSQCNLRPCQCVDLQNDPDNCGSCGHPCASHVCAAGVCQ